MKLVHLSDLHLGKIVSGFSMVADQQYILKQIEEIIEAERPDAVLLAGDLYDKSVPSAEAVRMLDHFLTWLAERRITTIAISGNHDSAVRTAFASAILAQEGIHMAPVYDGHIEPILLRDAYGEVAIYSLPYIKPIHVRQAFPEEEAGDYDQALRVAVSHIPLSGARRNVLLTHQFITGASRADSEEMAVGGLDQVDGEVFAAFDYVAAGHLHRPQNLQNGRIRYCGTPLKYSFSEERDAKSVTVVELGEKGDRRVRTVPLSPLHDMRTLRGSYHDLMRPASYQGAGQEDYLRIVLTDEEEILNGFGRLQTAYPNLMKLEYDNRRTRAQDRGEEVPAGKDKRPSEWFAALYEKQNGEPMRPAQEALLKGLIEEIWEEKE
ncbi:MAG: exonuclease SbcCD subunit D [Eubacteriales bacterium]|nr:exonuclease SbcCD subunit D [Eubacteriales bacterium]